MSRLLILGGCGAVGRVAATALAKQSDFSAITIGDRNAVAGPKLALELGPKFSFRNVNAEDPASVRTAISETDLALNCVGPFYRSVKTILAAALELKKNYVDVCDDVDATLDLLAWSPLAEQVGVTALIGIGSSPGVTNLLAAFAARNLLDETESVDIFHAHGGEPQEGPAVVAHRFHCMSIDIPMYLDGELRYVKYFGADGLALRQTFDFPVLGKDIPIYPYPHPEQVTLPRYVSLRRVTNKGTVLPNAYYELTRDLCALGFASKKPLCVNGHAITPHDFAITYILRERERILLETNFGSQRGCVSVIVTGRKNGKPETYRFHLASKSQALGEGTGIPAALGTLLMQRGKIKRKGVLPPEGCVDPLEFIRLVPSIMALDANKEDGHAFDGVLVERVDADGRVSKLDLV